MQARQDKAARRPKKETCYASVYLTRLRVYNCRLGPRLNATGINSNTSSECACRTACLVLGVRDGTEQKYRDCIVDTVKTQGLRREGSRGEVK